MPRGRGSALHRLSDYPNDIAPLEIMIRAVTVLVAPLVWLL
jgi:hypothetical protein